MSTTTPTSPRLRSSPNFVQARSFDGRPYVAQETEPYTQFWLSERERQLLALFGSRHGATLDEALEAHARLAGQAPSAAQARALRRTVLQMQQAGVLVDEAADTSRYDAAIVAAYVAHRPFPPELAAHLAQQAGLRTGDPVLDLAGGPGDLALALAGLGGAVSLMELSRGFLAAARQRARAQRLALTTLHDSCNRLVQRDEQYRLITVSQALHWLDDVQLCRGLCRVLAPDGSFFVIHSAIELADDHPLAWLLGHDSVLGAKRRQPFVDELQPLLRRLSGLFAVLDAPDLQRIDPSQRWAAPGSAPQAIGAAGVALFQQQRPFGPGYARGFLTPQHIAVTGQAPEAFWADVERRCAQATAAQLLGRHHWAVLHFQRGATAELPALAGLPVTVMPYSGPAEAV